MRLVEHCNRNPPRDPELRNQALRAAKSVALNIAEAASLSGRARIRFFSIARASLIEVAAAYELADALGDKTHTADVPTLADEIYAMLTKLIRS